GREQMGAMSPSRRGTSLESAPAGRARDRIAGEARRRTREPRVRVRHREPRPPREVAHGGGAVAREVALGEASERLVAGEAGRGRNPGVEERERRLLLAVGPEADQALLGEAREDVDAALAGGRNAGAGEPGVHLGARQGHTRAELADRERATLAE